MPEGKQCVFHTSYFKETFRKNSGPTTVERRTHDAESAMQRAYGMGSPCPNSDDCAEGAQYRKKRASARTHSGQPHSTSAIPPVAGSNSIQPF